MSETHNNNFDFLRFAAAAMLWYSHCHTLTGGHDPLTQWLPYESSGSLGISVFFIISGYFITASYERHRRLLPFLRNRIVRIMPALIMMLLLSVCVLGPLVTTLSLTAYMHDAQTWHYLKNLLIFPVQYDLPGVFQDHADHAVNFPLWTLPHGLRCYSVIPVLGMLGILQPRVMMAIFLTLAAFMLYGALIGSHHPDTFLISDWNSLHTEVHLGFLFAGGATVYMFKSHVPRHFGFLTACFLLIVLSVRLPELWGALLFDLALIYSVIYLGFLRLPLVPQFGRFGDFSYGMYLYAFPAQQLTLHYMHGNRGNFTLFMGISFTAALLCAIGSWYMVERPALRHKA